MSLAVRSLDQATPAMTTFLETGRDLAARWVSCRREEATAAGRGQVTRAVRNCAHITRIRQQGVLQERSWTYLSTLAPNITTNSESPMKATPTACHRPIVSPKVSMPATRPITGTPRLKGATRLAG